MKMIASSDSSFMPLSNTTVGDRIVATEARNDLMRMSSRFLNHSGFPDEVVFVHNGYWLQCRWFTDNSGLDWRVITVQAIDCDPGFQVTIALITHDHSCLLSLVRYPAGWPGQSDLCQVCVPIHLVWERQHVQVDL